MGDPFGLEMASERQRELLREAEERRIAGALRRFRRRPGKVGPSWSGRLPAMGPLQSTEQTRAAARDAS